MLVDWGDGDALLSNLSAFVSITASDQDSLVLQTLNCIATIHQLLERGV